MCAAGAISAAGAAAASAFDFWSQERANSQNKALFYADMEWKERMSRNAHQYEVEDLKKAGLNPMLSVNGGNMSSPSLSAPHMEATKINPLDVATTAKMWQDKKLAKALANTELTKQELNKAQKEIADINKQVAKAGLASAKNAEWFEKSKSGKVTKWLTRWKDAINPLSSAKDIKSIVK